MSKKSTSYKIGIDEAGRGPWLGSIVACAIAFNPLNYPEKKIIEKITDSKKLSENNREKIFSNLIQSSLGDNPKIFFGVGVVDNFVIDEINIKMANKEAMNRALIELSRRIDFSKLSGVFIDGNDNYDFEILTKKPVYIIKGDLKVLEIGAASIIAKVFRDRLMSQYKLLYPDLYIETHKGYGTKKHKDYLLDKSKITGIHRLSYKPIKDLLEKKEKLLLHICCGPDSIVPILDLKEKYEIICFWYDPNIHPKKEYNKRLKEFKKICKLENIEYIEGEYNTEVFFKKTIGLELLPEKSERCNICYDFRLEETAKKAKELGIKNFTTSLIISPHKDIKKIFTIGEILAKKEDLNFLKEDFRKNDGFNRSILYTKKNKIYRQNYCGCIYSETYPIIKK